MLPYGSEQMEYTKARTGNTGKMLLAGYTSLLRERRRQKRIRGMEGGTRQNKGTENR